MGQDSNIEWTKHTWNPWHGCKKVSEGCKFCYMYRDKDRYGLDPTKVVRSSSATFSKPKVWNDKDPGLVFTCSWSDFFIEEADEWRMDAWALIRDTPNLTYQILTKRPERIAQSLPPDWGKGYSNVWLGVSVENQKNADERIPILCAVPAFIHFVSAEPLLGSIDLRLLKRWILTDKNGNKISFSSTMENDHYEVGGIDWVIVGGESGNETGKWKYRECDIEWIHDIVQQCFRYRIPVFVKQLGTHIAKAHADSIWNQFQKDVNADRHGRYMSLWPKDIRVREMPKVAIATLLYELKGNPK